MPHLNLLRRFLSSFSHLRWFSSSLSPPLKESGIFRHSQFCVFLYPRPGYVPQVPTSTPAPIVLQAFCPPPFQEAGQEKLNLLCPVRALDTYVHRAAPWHKADQLFVCFGPPKKGCPATKQTISRWVVETISLAYDSSGLPSPMGVRAHSTRSMAASKAISLGVALQDICAAAGKSSPHTFVCFYNLDLASTPGSQVLSS